MKSGNLIEPKPVAKGGLQAGHINVERVSRAVYAEGKPFIGMLGQACTRQLTETAMQEPTERINLENN